jgi:hypothetical protein
MTIDNIDSFIEDCRQRILHRRSDLAINDTVAFNQLIQLEILKALTQLLEIEKLKGRMVTVVKSDNKDLPMGWEDKECHC